MLGVLDQEQLRALAVPARRHRPRPTVRARGRASAGCWSPTSPTATTSASSPTATTPAGCARSSATARPTTAATSSTRRPARCSASHDGTYGFTIGQRKGLRIGRPGARRQAALRARHRAGLRHRHRRPARASSRSTGSPAIRPRWCGTVADRGSTGTVQLRAHGDEHRAVVTVAGDEVDDRAARPGVRHRARPGRGGLRRHPGGRLGDDRATDRVARGAVAMTLATGVGSMPGDDDAGVRRGGAGRARRAARPAAPARAARPRRRRDDDRPRAGRASPSSAPTCSPPAGG